MDSRLGLRLCVPDHCYAAQCRHGIPRGRWYRHRSAHYRLCTRHTFEADGSTRSPAVAGVRSQWSHGNPAADRLSHQGAHQPVVLCQAVPRSGCPRARLPRIATDILPEDAGEKSVPAKTKALAITSLAVWALLIAAGRFLAYTHKWEMLGVPAMASD